MRQNSLNLAPQYHLNSTYNLEAYFQSPKLEGTNPSANMSPWLIFHNSFIACKNGVVFIYFLLTCHEQELISFNQSFDHHWMFWWVESTQTDSNYVQIFWIWVWKDWIWKVFRYNCIRNNQCFLSRYSNIFQFSPSDCFMCIQSLHGVVENETMWVKKMS